MDVDVSVSAGFLVQLSSLPEGGIVRATDIRLSTGSASLSLSGASVTVEGGPVDNISWSIAPDRDYAYVTIKVKRTKRLTDKYISEEVDAMLEALNLLVCGVGENVSNIEPTGKKSKGGKTAIDKR
jgi:hypothetical protein